MSMPGPGPQGGSVFLTTFQNMVNAINNLAQTWQNKSSVPPSLAAWNALGGFALGVNLNAVADTPINVVSPYPNYFLEAVWFFNNGPLASITTAKFGLFTAAGGGGSALIAAGQPLTALTATGVNNLGNAVVVAPNSPVLNLSQLFFRVTTAQGAAASCDVYLTIHPLPSV